MFLSQGSRVGQGYAFLIGDQCYALTAGHVLEAGSEPVIAVDAEAYRAEGRILNIDRQQDLGLVELAGDPRALRQVCRSPVPEIDDRLGDRLADRALPSQQVWLDKIASPAGGLDRMPLAFGPHKPSPDGDSVLLRTVSSSPSPQRGDSGAAVWMTRKPSSNARLTDNQGKPVTRVSAAQLLGVFVGLHDGQPRIVRGDRLHQFFYQSLAPIELNTLRIEPADYKLSDFRRGPFPSSGSVALSFTHRELSIASFELDLDDYDTTVVAVSVDVAPASDQRGRPVSQRIRVASSQYRPGHQDARWRDEPCQPDRQRKTRAGTVLCELKTPRVARGLRIEVQGAPSAVRGIRVEAAS